MGVWSIPLGVWPRNLIIPTHLLTDVTKHYLCTRCVAEIGEMDTLDDFMTSMQDTYPKIMGYLTPAAYAAWANLLNSVADANKEATEHGISLFFYCIDTGQLYALHHAPGSTCVYLRESTFNFLQHNAETKAGQQAWMKAGMWVEGDVDGDCVELAHIDYKAVADHLHTNAEFGAPAGHLWRTLMKNPSPPPAFTMPFMICDKVKYWPTLPS